MDELDKQVKELESYKEKYEELEKKESSEQDLEFKLRMARQDVE